jgi:hypothetical protein
MQVKNSNEKKPVSTYLVDALIIAIGIIVVYVTFYKPLQSKQKEIAEINSSIQKKEEDILKLVEKYNQMDGYQKVKLNDQGNIEYYDIKESPTALASVNVETKVDPYTAKPIDQDFSDNSPKNSYDSEVSPEIYKHIDFLVKNTNDEGFKAAIKIALEDDKITYGEYQSLSKPMNIISKQVEHDAAKLELMQQIKK